MTNNNRRKWRVLAGLLLLLCLVSLLLLPFRGERPAAPVDLAGIEPAREPPTGTAAAAGASASPTATETGLASQETLPTATGEIVAAPTETRPPTRETTPAAIVGALSTPTATRRFTRTATPTAEVVISAPTIIETQPKVEETLTPTVEGRAENNDPASEFNTETGTPEENEVGSSEPVGTAPVTSLTVTATLALTNGASIEPATEAERTITPTVPVVKTGESLTPTVMVSPTVEAAEETTLTATPTQEDSLLPEEVESTPPRPAVVDPIMEHMAGERLETQPDEPAGASPSGTAEAATPDPISEQAEPDLPPAPGDIPAPDNLPTTGLSVGASSPPFWVAGGVTVLLLAVGAATLLRKCE